METASSDPTSGCTHTVHVSDPVLHKEDSGLQVSTVTIHSDVELDTATVEKNNYIDPENAGTESVYVVSTVTTDNDESETSASTATGHGHGDAYFGTETVISNNAVSEKANNNSVLRDKTVENSKIITICCSPGKKVYKKLKTGGADLNANRKEAVRQAEKKVVSLPYICNMSPKDSSAKPPVIMFKWGSYKQPFGCQICDMLFSSGDLLQQHMQKHALAQNDPRKQFQCNLCLKSFQSRHSLELHQLSHSGQGQNTCRYCYKVFANKENLYRHIVIHGDSKPHSCPYCNEGFALFRSLQQHISKHLGWKDFKCHVCSRGFKRKDILDRHMFTHKLESEKKHKCVECGKDLRFLFSLKKHVRNIHRNEPDGKECEICGKFIKNRENLGRHMLTHSGQRSHECPTCGQKFTQKTHLQDHMLLHMKPSAYILCNVCDRLFQHEWIFRRHLNKHYVVVNKDELQCRRCSEIFTTQEEIIEHCKTHHKESELLKLYSGKRTLCSKTMQITSEELSKKTKEQDVELSGGDVVKSNTSLNIRNEAKRNKTSDETVTSEDMAVGEESNTKISEEITFIVVPRGLEIAQVYSPDGTQLNFNVDHLGYVKKSGNQSIKINPKIENDQNDENNKEDKELVKNSMVVDRSKQQEMKIEQTVTESPEISGSQNLSDCQTDSRVLLQSSVIDYAVKMQDLESGNWVPLDEYYYGTRDGDPSYTEEKGEYRFKCWCCSKMLYNNVRAMQHIQGHIDASKMQNIDLSDLTQCKYCYKHFDTPSEMQTHVEKVHLSNKVLMCRICERNFTTPRELTQHMKGNHHACEMPYVCHRCNFRSSMYSDVVDHFKKRHDSSHFMLCLYCLRTFEVKFVSQGWGQTQTYYGHLLKHRTKSSTKKCVVCRLTFFNAFDVKIHRKNCHVGNHLVVKVSPHSGNSEAGSNKKQGSQLKSLNAPSVSRIQDYGTVVFPEETNTAKCIECKMIMSSTDHFKKYVHCTMCRFATSCSVAYAKHMMGFHTAQMTSLNMNIPSEWPMKDIMYCACGFKSAYGNKVANHLVYCGKWTCYSTQIQASSQIAPYKGCS